MSFNKKWFLLFSFVFFLLLVLGIFQVRSRGCDFSLVCMVNNCRKVSFLENIIQGQNPVMEKSVVYGNYEKKQIRSISGYVEYVSVKQDSLNLDLMTKEGVLYKIMLPFFDINNLGFEGAVVAKRRVFGLRCNQGVVIGNDASSIRDKKLISEYEKEDLINLVLQGDYVTVVPWINNDSNINEDDRLVGSWIIIRRFL